MQNKSVITRRKLRYWWAFLLSGIVLFTAGLVVLQYPVGSYITISLFFGWLVFLLGLGHISFVISNRKTLPVWAWHLVTGIVDIAIGLVLIFYPDITMDLLPFLVCIWFFIRGVSLISYGLALKKLRVRNWGWMLTGGILTFLVAIFILYNPFAGFITIILWTGLAFMASGLFNVLLAFQLREDKDDIESVIL